VTAAMSLLHRVLAPRGLSVVYQPIMEVKGDVALLHGVECLTRGPVGTHVESPTILFEYVRRRGEEVTVDRACLTAALENASILPGLPRLSLNVHASTLSRDEDFPAFLADAAESVGVARGRLTVEIVENAPPHDGPAFSRSLRSLRASGMLIALDDVGLGHSNYKMIVDVQPDYFKIDRYFVRAVHDDSYRMAVLESVARLAERVGARVVAEGVETEAELASVVGLGIDLVQGFLFAPPLSPEGAARHEIFQGDSHDPEKYGETSNEQET
jgi:EAL domain-containing protein (putative c-di-GMP-specific phosphodiesterase class I)